MRFSLDEILEWREQIEFDGPVYAGVMVVPSVAMARKIGGDIAQLAVPDEWIAAIERDPSAGVRLACDLVDAIRESGAFDGVHLIPVSKYREVAARLESTSALKRPHSRGCTNELAGQRAAKRSGATRCSQWPSPSHISNAAVETCERSQSSYPAAHGKPVQREVRHLDRFHERGEAGFAGGHRVGVVVQHHLPDVEHDLRIAGPVRALDPILFRRRQPTEAEGPLLLHERVVERLGVAQPGGERVHGVTQAAQLERLVDADDRAGRPR